MFLTGMAIGCFFIYRKKEVDGIGFDDLMDGVRDTTFFDPHALLLIVLPPLLYESASSMQWHTLKKILPSCLMLAVPGVIFNTLATGIYVRYLVGTGANYDDQPSWEASWLLATILSATDPVAVVSALSALGAPAKLSSIVEGESLLNDGSAVVLCYVFIDWVAQNEPAESKLNPQCEGTSPNIGCVVPFFMRMAIGGVGLGLIAGFVLQLWIKYAHKHHDPRLELSIICVFVYGTFFVAESSAFHVSGVLAVVTLGFVFTIAVKSALSHEARHDHHVLMAQIAYICNQLTFFVAGVVAGRFMWVDTSCSHTFWGGWRPTGELFGLYIFIHLTRGGVTLLFTPLLRRMGYGLTWKEGIIMVYGGLRGAVGLIMGLIVEHNPYIDAEVRQMISFHTGGIVLLTLCINGSTIDDIYKRLDPYPINPIRQHNLKKILEKVEADCQKIGIKVIASDWFFSDCLFNKLLQCVPHFGCIEFDDAKKPEPIGIEHVSTTLSRLYMYASAFRKDQVAKMNQNGETFASKWQERTIEGDLMFTDLMNSKQEVTSRSDTLCGVRAEGFQHLAYHKPSSSSVSKENGAFSGLYVSGLALDKLKNEDDDEFGFEVEITELEDVDIIVGLIAEPDMAHMLKPFDECQLLGIHENSIGYNCSNGTICRNGPYGDDNIETRSCPQKGDKVSVQVTRRPRSEWEIEFGLQEKDSEIGAVIQRFVLGPFAPEEMYPVLEFRPSGMSGFLDKSGSKSSSSIVQKQSSSALSTATGAAMQQASGAALAALDMVPSQFVTSHRKWEL
jgi:NhaP-type Na+/H+ or K+/H+ antiporter